MAEINIGKDFNDHPIGRFYSDGEGSGEQFREEVLLKTLKGLRAGEKINIILDDGVEGYGSSFLVEAFAGLVKFGHIKKNDLLDILTFTYKDEDFSFYEEKIYQYIEQAKYKSDEYKGNV